MSIPAGRPPRGGDVLVIDRRASVQFGEPFLFRLIRVMDLETYHGWVWLDGYELGPNGDAVQRRELFVQVDGLRLWRADVVRPARPRATGNAGARSYSVRGRVSSRAV